MRYRDLRKSKLTPPIIVLDRTNVTGYISRCGGEHDGAGFTQVSNMFVTQDSSVSGGQCHQAVFHKILTMEYTRSGRHINWNNSL